MNKYFLKIKTFWNIFFASIKQAYNSTKQPLQTMAQNWRDITRQNFLAIFVNTLNNLTNIQATFDVETDSTQAEPIKELCADIEEKRYKITSNMLADGDYFIFPYTNRKGEIIHSYLTQAQVRILDTDGDQITKAYGIIDWTVDDKNRVYYLLRNHELDIDGNLTVSYSVMDDNARPATVAEWEYLKDEAVTFIGANHIGFGRYKSPADSRGLSAVYGVPLNFGCADIEKDIFEDLKNINDEFKNGKSKIFTDPRNLLKDNETNQYRIAENIIPIKQRDGVSGANIDIFNPNLRYSEHYSKYVGDLARYEKQVGTSKGILTDNETSYTATATAVKRANADTIALIDKIQTAIDAGNRMTLEADSMYLNIPKELWNYRPDWYDAFEDPAEQWERLKDGKTVGAVETKDIVQWIFPQLTPEQIDDKIERIKAEEKESTNMAIERLLQ